LSGATMSGGFLDVQSGASASGIVAFGSAGGTFELDEARTYGLTLAGFGVPGAIDFAAVAFGSSTSATYTSTGIGSGTLSVTDGAHTAALALLGQYVTANFHLSDDGHGGTLVVDPPVSSGAGIATPH